MRFIVVVVIVPGFTSINAKKVPPRPLKMTLNEVHDNALRQTAAPRCRFRALCGWLARGRCEDGRDLAERFELYQIVLNLVDL